jgi:hypothetical protein
MEATEVSGQAWFWGVVGVVVVALSGVGAARRGSEGARATPEPGIEPAPAPEAVPVAVDVPVSGDAAAEPERAGGPGESDPVADEDPGHAGPVAGSALAALDSVALMSRAARPAAQTAHPGESGDSPG